MLEHVTMEQIDQTAGVIRSHIALEPRVGIILGSGLGPLAESVEKPTIIPYKELPSWPVSTVHGHQGQLVIGSLEDQPVIVMQGRAHFYEGYSMAQITMPVRVMQRMGFSALFITNAAGAINPDYSPGDVMLITDHLALMGMTGLNPLYGPNLDEFGVRFPDMSQVYHPDLMAMAREVAGEEEIQLREGVYVGLSGPSYETPAELRFLNAIGADAVGMSTVHEAIVAHHGNLPVLGFSGISNKANLDGSTLTTHEEVLEAGSVIVPNLKAILLGVLRRL